ncbi:MAG TPA: hypothetical protein VGM89_10940 [Puia sp.]
MLGDLGGDVFSGGEEEVAGCGVGEDKLRNNDSFSGAGRMDDTGAVVMPEYFDSLVVGPLVVGI